MTSSETGILSRIAFYARRFATQLFTSGLFPTTLSLLSLLFGTFNSQDPGFNSNLDAPTLPFLGPVTSELASNPHLRLLLSVAEG
jgi:hypothetical protein